MPPITGTATLAPEPSIEARATMSRHVVLARVLSRPPQYGSSGAILWTPELRA